MMRTATTTIMAAMSARVRRMLLGRAMSRLSHRIYRAALDIEAAIAAAPPIPVRWGNFEYWESSLPDQYSTLERRRIAAAKDGVDSSSSSSILAQDALRNAVERVVDCNVLAAAGGGGGYVNLVAIRVSPDHAHVAYIADTTGRDEFKLFVNDCATGKVVQEATVENVIQVEWIDDNHYVYTKADHTGRPSLVCCSKLARRGGSGDPHHLGGGWSSIAEGSSGVAEDRTGASTEPLAQVVFQEHRAAFCLDLNRAKDGSFIVLVSRSPTCSTTFLLRLHHGQLVLDKFFPGDGDGQEEVFVESLGNYYYCLYRSSLSADLEVRRAAKSQRLPLRPDQLEIVQCGDDDDMGSSSETRVADMSVLSSGLVVQCQTPFSSTLRFVRIVGDDVVGTAKIGVPADVLERVRGESTNRDPRAKPADGLSIAPLMNCDFDAQSFFATVSSASAPGIPLEWRVEDNECAVAMGASDLVFEGVSQRHSYYSARDGCDVPVSILTPSDPGRWAGRVLVEVYGAYGVPDSIDFDALKHSFVRCTGWAYATAHVRGSGQRGRRWHTAGSGRRKHVSGQDLADCVRYLGDQGYTRDGLVSLLAASAGAVPAAQTIYEIPHLIASAALRAPLVDLCGAAAAAAAGAASSSSSVTLGEHERAEWGPEHHHPGGESEYAAYIRTICPTATMPDQETRLPATMVSAYTNDTRVQCRGILKWAAKLQQIQSDSSRPVVVLVDNRPVDPTQGSSSSSASQESSAGFGHMGRGGASGLLDSARELEFVVSHGYATSNSDL